MFKVVFLLLAVGCLAALGQHLDRKEYVVFHEEVNWIGAIEFCHRLRMKPAVINNREEQQQIEITIKFNQRPNPDPHFGESSIYWIGGSNLSNKHEFFWEPTGERFTYSKWDINEPNKEFNCAVIKYSSSTQETGQWLSFECDKPLQSFVCEVTIE